MEAYGVATRTAPESTDDVKKVRLVTETLESSVASSGLSGDVQKLLVDAAHQEGDARLLLKKEVQEFLTQHPGLWKQLKVKLG